jgi:holo-[acyl-carrier protein] synthase
MIFGIGLDLVDITRVQENLQRFGEKFEDKMFTPHEREYCRGKVKPAIHYAARFAAKEAFVKALGSGMAHGITWHDIEILSKNGWKPRLNISGRAAELVAERGVGMMHITLSHAENHAAAMVVLEKAAEQ